MRETTFDEIIDEMIANAWYFVRELHIHLSGIQADGLVWDDLERAILLLAELSELPSNASKVEIKNAVHEYNKELEQAKEQLYHILEKNMQPVYDSASRQGYEIWNKL